MIEICPLCGRYSLTDAYPPKPCPICEEELSKHAAIPPTSCCVRSSQLQHIPERRADA
ncbi:hypothetical protein Pcar_3152 [Syntrophotalea carbinolica DSM 2380]|uniref:Uncharacterized protein n=1 Tax=Syntrophotalea carbinolica (strain DSM 2380 / NBRC 103641 / GraBd1) TaxID=338963 RepID=Q0C714_SYNC1|nr:hypothetical protein [Syntrophotalea carbinolica]ABI81773.1 hypothetical protein Pcar_3152 [Syntrophotalea carbinolica DSM 2380]